MDVSERYFCCAVVQFYPEWSRIPSNSDPWHRATHTLYRDDS